MNVDVESPVKIPPTIGVPADAVLDSGLKKTVFVDRGQVYFASGENRARFNQNPSAYADKLSDVSGGPSGPKK